MYINAYVTVLAKRDHYVGVANFVFLHYSLAFQTHCNMNPLALFAGRFCPQIGRIIYGTAQLLHNSYLVYIRRNFTQGSHKIAD